MTRILMFLAAAAASLAAFAARPPEASAASMAYCETWADRVAANSPEAGDATGRKAVRDKSYFDCLNMDEEPPLPAVAQELYIDQSGSPFKTLEVPPVEAAPGSAPTFAAPREAAVEEPASEQPVAQGDSDDGDVTGTVETEATGEDDGQGRGSGKPRGSPEWAEFCAKYYPKSFDPQTGTVVPVKIGRRVPCR